MTTTLPPRSLNLTGATNFRDLGGYAGHGGRTVPGVAVHFLPIEPTVVQRMQDWVASGQTLTAHDTVGLMQQTYRAFVHNAAGRFAELFAQLLDNDAPLVFHCTAGKDRTGFAAALILLALGVPRPVVMQDYLLSNALYPTPRTSAHQAPQEVLDVVWSVCEAFLEAALHAVDTDFGGVSRYLQEALAVGPREQERLAQLYLSAA